MAQKVVTIYTDDLTGEEAEDTRTVPFSIEGIAYEMDLSPDSKDKFLEAIGPFVKVARRTGKVQDRMGKPSAGSRKTVARSQGNPDTAKIREWAKEQGYDVNDRGRVPATIREAYEKANA